MKKNKLIYFSILGLLYLLPFINFVSAQPGSYVAVGAGDTIVWKATLEEDNLADFNTDYPEWGAAFELSGFTEGMSWVAPWDEADTPELQIEATVESVGDELSNIIYYTDKTLYKGTPVFVTMADITTPADYYDNEAVNIGSSHEAFMSQIGWFYVQFHIWYYGATALFASTSIMWSQFAAYGNSVKPFFPSPISEATTTATTNGFTYTIPAATIGPTQKVLTSQVAYNSDGILENYEVSYDDVLLATWEIVSYTPATEDSAAIPGYTLPIIIGLTAAGSVALIYRIWKKNKLIN
jgi:hypothetical protein